MIPELGHFALLLALALSLGLAIFPALGVRFQNQCLCALGSLWHSVFLLLCYQLFCLLYAFVNDDFTVTYLPITPIQPCHFLTISAIWGAHEGSFLLWTLIMSGWTLAVALFNRSLTTDITARFWEPQEGSMLGLAFLLFCLKSF